jgi:hypothetical protein
LFIQVSKLPCFIYFQPPTKQQKYSAVYRFSRACIFTNPTGVEGSTQIQANIILPEINKLALEAKSGSLAILLVSWGMQEQCLIWIVILIATFGHIIIFLQLERKILCSELIHLKILWMRLLFHVRYALVDWLCCA